jgi:hypothetical protein
MQLNRKGATMTAQSSRRGPVSKGAASSFFTPAGHPLGAQAGAPIAEPGHYQAHPNSNPAPLTSTFLLAQLADLVGRKFIHYELRISKSLLKKWFDEGGDPIERTRKIIGIAVKHNQPEIGLGICQLLIAELGGVALSARHRQMIREIADAIGQ